MKTPQLLVAGGVGGLFFGFLFPQDRPAGRVPFRLHDNHLIVVQGSIGPLENLNLVIDTGSSSTVIDSRLARKLQLQGAPHRVVAVGKKIEIQKVTLPNLSIGTVRFQEAPAWVQSLSVFEQQARQPIRIDALIGLDLLKRSGLTIDYEARELVFGPVAHAQPATPFYPGLPFITVHLVAGEGSVRLLFDTGAESVILDRRRAAQRIAFQQTPEIRSVTYAGGEVGLKKIHLADVRIGARQWDRLEAFLLDGPVHSGGLDGVLSVSALGLKRVHLDFQRGLISWQ